MSYSTREIGVPSTVATGGVAGAAAFSGAGGGVCWPFPQAVTLTANAVRMAIRIHGVLKNWLICSSTQKKSDYGLGGQRARGRQFSLNRAISPIFDAFCACKPALSRRSIGLCQDLSGGSGSIASAGISLLLRASTAA